MLKHPLLIIVVILALVMLGGFALLGTMDIPAPTSHVERTIPNDRLPR